MDTFWKIIISIIFISLIIYFVKSLQLENLANIPLSELTLKDIAGYIAALCILGFGYESIKSAWGK